MTRFLLLFAAGVLSGCGAPAFSEINRAPTMSPVGSGISASAAQADYSYPQSPSRPVKRFSLWNDRQSRLFTDPRALAPGDILTVKIEISDRAKFKNESDRSRKVARSLDLSASGDWNNRLSGEATGTGNLGSNTSTNGTGSTTRSEDLALSVAAVVTDVMPNGNLVIHGSQEVRVNYELRVLTIGGIVRPKDIGPENTISYERIAEARISYGGRGRLSEVQQPPYGQQIIDNYSPL